jgi:hypothetical protein
MAMVSERTITRRDTIARVISAELERQALDGAERVDIETLADAIESAIAEHSDVSEGRHPNELNSSNDD